MGIAPDPHRTEFVGLNAFDLTGEWSWKKLMTNASKIGKSITDSRFGKAAFFVCGFIPVTAVSVACGAVQALAYVAQGRYGEAAVAAIGMIPGAKLASGLERAGRSVIKAGIRRAYRTGVRVHPSRVRAQVRGLRGRATAVSNAILTPSSEWLSNRKWIKNLKHG